MRELTKAEDQVMQVLWKLEKAFVKDIIEQLPEPKPAYNTVSTIFRILENKGFVNHKAYGKTYEYYPIVSKETYSKFTIQNVLQNYFGGSMQNLVSFFAKNENLSLQEIEALQKELANIKKENHDEGH
ncbi:MAG: BlaI/MecI/CopY family transcriptional regulator [Chryseotalea sp.]